jgi:two-component system, OmpR family, response regulator
MRILIVESDSKAAGELACALRKVGHAADHVETGCAADIALMSNTHDMLILDIGVRGTAGMRVISRARTRNIGIPILTLGSTTCFATIARALDSGADDFMSKPPSLDELLARVRALIRRTAQRRDVCVTVGNLTFNLTGKRAEIDDRPLHLSSREADVLGILAKRASLLVSKQQLADDLVGWSEEVTRNAIEVYIHRLRKRLIGSGAQITTEKGVGYRLEPLRDSESRHNAEF